MYINKPKEICGIDLKDFLYRKKGGKKCMVHVARHVSSDGFVKILERQMEELTKGTQKN